MEFWVVLFETGEGTRIGTEFGSPDVAIAWAKNFREQGCTILAIVRVPEGQFDVELEP